MIPIVSPPVGKPYASVRQILSGTEFRLDWAYNTRLDSWFMSVFRPLTDSQDFEPIQVGALVTMGFDLLGRCQHARRPLGSLYVTAAGGLRDVGLLDIQEGRARVVYLEPGEAVAA